MLLTEGFLGWLSRFKLIRLRRISLATLRRDGLRDGQRDGQRDGCQYMYCLPPAGGRIRSQGNKMRLKPKGFIESSTLGAIMNERRNGQREGPEGGGAVLALLWSKK